MRARRRAVPAAERAEAGRLLAGRLCAWPLLPRGACVASFLSLPEELPTGAINAALESRGCRLVVPAWSAYGRRYRFAEWRAADRLAAGPMQVPEPAAPRWAATAGIALFLVPGLAFDRAGGRIGYGGGHYDRLLAERAPASRCVALGYDWQLVEALPQDADDVRMDWVMTPLVTVRTGTPDSL
jgi:5-formyltetrahydrofolate cyclo-ligase